MKIKAYISGPITGKPDGNKPAFAAAAKTLRADGWLVVNPHDVNAKHPGVWESHMRADIQALMKCDYVRLLPGWSRSRGARLEVAIANALGIPVDPL